MHRTLTESLRAYFQNGKSDGEHLVKAFVAGWDAAWAAAMPNNLGTKDANAQDSRHDSETPRTDAAIIYPRGGTAMVRPEFAREIERELAEEKSEHRATLAYAAKEREAAESELERCRGLLRQVTKCVGMGHLADYDDELHAEVSEAIKEK